MAKNEKGLSAEDRRELINVEASGYRDYNKTALLLTTGALVFSLFFLYRVSSPYYILFIVYSWLFWGLATMLQMAALSMYPKIIREEILILAEGEKEEGQKLNRYAYMISKMSLLSTLSFGLGIFFFLVFVLFNVNCLR